MKELAKRIADALVAGYRINWIVATPPRRSLPADPDVRPAGEAERAMLDASPTEAMRKAAGYGRGGMDGFVIMADGKPACVVHYCNAAGYYRNSTWAIAQDEVALMDIATEEAMRGQGLAARLMRDGEARYVTQGRARRLIAFIWWNNTPSLRAFAKAGWRRIGFSIEVRVGDNWRGLRLPLP